MDKFIKFEKSCFGVGDEPKTKTVYVDPEKVTKIEGYSGGTIISATGLGWHAPAYFGLFTSVGIVLLVMLGTHVNWAERYPKWVENNPFFVLVCIWGAAFCFWRNLVVGINRLYVTEAVEDTCQKINGALSER